MRVCVLTSHSLGVSWPVVHAGEVHIYLGELPYAQSSYSLHPGLSWRWECSSVGKVWLGLKPRRGLTCWLRRRTRDAGWLLEVSVTGKDLRSKSGVPPTEDLMSIPYSAVSLIPSASLCSYWFCTVEYWKGLVSLELCSNLVLPWMFSALCLLSVIEFSNKAFKNVLKMTGAKPFFDRTALHWSRVCLRSKCQSSLPLGVHAMPLGVRGCCTFFLDVIQFPQNSHNGRLYLCQHILKISDCLVKQTKGYSLLTILL